MHTVGRLRGSERGYNLVEVLIAMALLGTVLMSIMGLFYFGRRNVYSGKEMTEAVAMSTQVLEDLNTMTKPGVLAAFGLPNATAGTTINFGGQTFTNSFIRTTTDITATTDPNGYLARWRDEIVNNKKFQTGVVTVVFTPDKDRATPAAPVLGTATLLRMRVFVTWGESVRQRQVVVDAVKLDHTAS